MHGGVSHVIRAWGSGERCKSMPPWKDSKGGHAIRAPRGKVIATAYRPHRQALHKEPRTPIYKRETMHIRLATTWHMCAPDCHGALFLRTRRPSRTPSEGHAQSGCIDIGIAARNREEYAIPQSSRSAREAGLPPARIHDRLERAQPPGRFVHTLRRWLNDRSTVL